MSYSVEKKYTKQLIVLYPFRNSNYQNFMQGLADCLISAGYKYIRCINLPWKLRLLFAKLRISRNIRFLTFSNKTLIVFGGGYIDSFVFPYSYIHEIIPILWDTWPRYWDRIIASFKRHNVKLAFFTQGQVADYIQSQLPGVRCIYLPEGLNPAGYKKGDLLSKRKIDILELGRIFSKFHDRIVNTHIIGLNVHLYAEHNLLFKTFEDLVNGLSSSKIVICFPRCDTHPEQAGVVETLTQRYWECMFSRALILGHAPKELIELLGYNPVIEVDWSNLENQIEDVLNNIDTYQELVDRNYVEAFKKGTWVSRLSLIKYYLDIYEKG